MIEVAAWTACISASSGTSETAGVVEAGTGSAAVTVGLGGPASTSAASMPSAAKRLA